MPFRNIFIFLKWFLIYLCICSTSICNILILLFFFSLFFVQCFKQLTVSGYGYNDCCLKPFILHTHTHTNNTTESNNKLIFLLQYAWRDREMWILCILRINSWWFYSNTIQMNVESFEYGSRGLTACFQSCSKYLFVEVNNMFLVFQFSLVCFKARNLWAGKVVKTTQTNFHQIFNRIISGKMFDENSI